MSRLSFAHLYWISLIYLWLQAICLLSRVRRFMIMSRILSYIHTVSSVVARVSLDDLRLVHQAITLMFLLSVIMNLCMSLHRVSCWTSWALTWVEEIFIKMRAFLRKFDRVTTIPTLDRTTLMYPVILTVRSAFPLVTSTISTVLLVTHIRWVLSIVWVVDFLCPHLLCDPIGKTSDYWMKLHDEMLRLFLPRLWTITYLL